MLLRVVLRSRQLRQTCIPPCRLKISPRSFASTACLKQDETVPLKVGGNGFINLTISKPTHPNKNKSTSSNILVRLPPGPFPGTQGLKESTTLDSQQLSKHLPNTTIIDIQYRLAPRPSSQAAHPERDDRFPTPIHDIFTAWDYITDRIVQHEDPKICLLGSHIGGALALTLALTDPSRIYAIAIEDPLVDWVGLDELAAFKVEDTAATKRRTTKHGGREAMAAAAKVLVNLRTQLFRSPSGYFDAFASPVLFLRAPGRDTPLTKTATLNDLEGAPMRYGEEEDEVGMVGYDGRDEAFGPYDDDWHAVETRRIREGEYRHDTSRTGTASASTDKSSVGSEKQDSASESGGTSLNGSTVLLSAPVDSPRRRKVLRRWLPNAQSEELVLPHVNVFLTKPLLDMSKQVLYDQAQSMDTTPVTWLQGRELAELLKRACFWGREKSFAEERVTVTEHNPASDHVERKDQVSKWLQTRFEDRG